ncbi:hypothetical protein F2Q70_00037293, partial [Brassica cretica]
MEIPTEWNDQFESGIQIPEDLHFVLRMRHTFESLGYQSGFYLSQLFSSNQSISSSNTSLMVPNHPVLPPQTQPLLEWHKPTTNDGSILIAYPPHSHAFP